MTLRGKIMPGPKRPDPNWMLAAWLGMSLGVLAAGAMALGVLTARPGPGS